MGFGLDDSTKKALESIPAKLDQLLALEQQQVALLQQTLQKLSVARGQ